MHESHPRMRLLALLTSVSAALIGASGALAAPTPGAVYTETNGVPANFVKIFSRAPDGRLVPAGEVATGGFGTTTSPPFGFPITDSQGAVTLSGDGRLLFAVNAGSNTISSFQVTPDGLTFVDQVSSNGEFPNSVAINQRNILYVLNEGSDSIAGFTVSPGGVMTSLPGSTRSLDADSEGAQVGFNHAGDVLAVTERATSRIDTWLVSIDGSLGPTVVTPSTGEVPFGFAFTQRDQLFVTNAGELPFGPVPSTASSYAVDRATATLTPLDFQPQPFVLTACWAAITNDNRYVYTTSPLDQAISAFAINRDGTFDLLDAHAATASGLALDEALSRNSKYLYVLSPTSLAFTSSSIDVWAVNGDGSLSHVQTVGGLPGTSSGLAAS